MRGQPSEARAGRDNEVVTDRDPKVEALLALSLDDAGDGRGDVKTFDVVRELSKDESAASLAAGPLLAAITKESAFADLTVATDDLHEQFDRLEGSARRGQVEVAARLRRVQREFKSWLSSFKSFDDRTSRWLSHRFPGESAVQETFKNSLSREFDANFGYRICCTLRNITEHAGDVINSVHVTSRLKDPSIYRDAHVRREDAAVSDDDVVHATSLQLNAPKLAKDYPKRMRAKTRAELASVTKPIAVETIVGAAYQSCMRAHASLVVALWPEISQAVEIIEAHHHEAIAAGGLEAVFATNESVDALASGRRSFTLRPNWLDLALLARKNFGESTQLVSQEPVIYEWTDFTE